MSVLSCMRLKRDVVLTIHYCFVAVYEHHNHVRALGTKKNAKAPANTFT